MKLEQINFYYNTKESLTEQIKESENLLEVYKKALQVAESLKHRKRVDVHFFKELKKLDETLGGYIDKTKNLNSIDLVVFYKSHSKKFCNFRLYFYDKEQFTYDEIKEKLLEKIHALKLYLKSYKKDLESLESDTKKLKETIEFIRSQKLNKNFSYEKLYGALLSAYNDSLI